MADKKISQLSSAVLPLAGTEVVPVVQSGATVKVTAASLGAAAAYTPAGTGAVVSTVQTKLREIRSSNDNPTWGTRNVGYGLSNLPNSGFTGVENTALGADNLKALTTGYANGAFGVDVLSANTTGAFNFAVGIKALLKNTTGNGNTAFGAYSTYENKTGSSNSGFGEDSNRYVDGGNRNVAVGTQSLYNNVTGNDNTAVGTYAARNAANPPDDGAGTGPSPTFLTAIGGNALYTASGTLNTAIGYDAGYLATGSYNTFLGAESGSKIVSGAYNVHIGYNAGQNASQSATGSYQVVIGRDSYATGNNAIAIGSAVVASANQCVIGNASQTGVFLYGNLQPQTDNSQPIGGASSRWSVVYAGTGTINTSDERTKQQIKPIDSAALRAWAKVEYVQYKFNDAVELKGDGARWHFGVIAQRVKEAFESEGLDAFAYGVLCYDEWKSEPEVLNAEGEVFKPAIQAGNRYGIRYEEALAIECAYLRSRIA
jgi:hypothetical protein